MASTRVALVQREVHFGIHAGNHHRLGFGTSTSVSMVRVASDTLSENRATSPGKLRFKRRHPNLHLLADVHGGHGRFRNRQDQAQQAVLRESTTGMACVCDAVPAWIIDPVSAYRLVTTPANGAVTRV